MNADIPGLNPKEVRTRTEKGFVNTLPPPSVRSATTIALEKGLTLFNAINFAIITLSLAIYISTGNDKFLWDTLSIAAITIVNTSIAFIQELRAVRKLASLELLRNLTATVVRDGQRTIIPISDIVQDDVLFIQKGDQIPVDCSVITSRYLEIDESLVTGESLPVHKTDGATLLSGSYCVLGNAHCMAVRVGAQTYSSEITQIARTETVLSSPLLRHINVLFTWSFAVTAVMVVVQIALDAQTGYSLAHNFREISTIAISLIPEGLVFFSSLTFLLAIIRISALGATVRKFNAVDGFATVDVLCLDKTGTLTRNNLVVEEITGPTTKKDRRNVEALLGTFGHFSTEQNPTIEALHCYKPIEHAELGDELPFRSEIKMSAMNVSLNGTHQTLILGGFDVLLPCVAEGKREEILENYRENNLAHFRNLIFCHTASFVNAPLSPDSISQSPLIPICILSLKDETRTDVAETLSFLRKQGVAIKILSGDSGDAVGATLRDIGVNPGSLQVINGDEIDLQQDGTISSEVLHNDVFTRLRPEQKLKIVQSLRNAGLRTAFVGDGVNDLPAIKEADVGIAMESGTAISRGAADIVLNGDRLSALQDIFREGHRTINTVSFVSRLYLSKNGTLVVLIAASWLLSFQHHLTPRNTSLITLLGIGLPIFIIALRNANVTPTRNFLGNLVWFTAISIAIVSAFWIGTYMQLIPTGHDIAANPAAIAIPVGTLLVILNFLCAVVYDDRHNHWLYVASGLVMAVLYLLVVTVLPDMWLVNILRTFYETTPVSVANWGAISAIVAPATLLLCIVHYIRYKRSTQGWQRM